MRVHWWQSIRWRLALGSMLVAFLATALLSLIIIITINVSYSGDQLQHLTTTATGMAQRIGIAYTRTSDLNTAVKIAFPPGFARNAENEEYLQIVYTSVPPIKSIYPVATNGKPISPQLLVDATDPSVRARDFTRLGVALGKARRGTPTVGEIGTSGPIASTHPFAVEPIFAGDQVGASVVGELVVMPRSAADNTLPPFLAAVRQSVLLASLIVAALAALAAILFSRTITRPLAKLTGAARIMAEGDYSARVQTSTPGELGELAHTFNEMATRLETDVDELRRQELSRRELIMNITHDLATPLTAIAGLGEALVDGINQNHEDYEETGRIIVRETHRLRRLVKDLHMMAKAEAGAMQPIRRAVRLAILVDEVFAALTPEFERADVEPLNNVAYNLPAVWADADMLSRVFSNLCSNALNYTPAGGTIAVDASQQDTTLEIAVTDSGKGIPTTALPRVFDRFYRADPSRQMSTGGSGLGLAIVRAIIEAHGGTVRAENSPSGGACIIFTLPLASPEWDQLASSSTLPLPLNQ